MGRKGVPAMLVLVLLLALWPASHNGRAQETGLDNPGFEAGPWEANHPQRVATDTTQVHGGQRSVRVLPLPGDDVFMLSNLVPIDVELSYVFSVWIRTDSLPSDAVSVRVLEVDPNNVAIGWHVLSSGDNRLVTTGGTHDWQRFDVELSGFNSRTAYLKFYLWVAPAEAGTAWFDDAAFARSSRPGEDLRLSVTTPRLGNVFPPGEEVSGTVTVRSLADEPREVVLRQHVEYKDGTVVLDRDTSLTIPPRGTVDVRLAFTPRLKGVYYGRFALLDQQGEELRVLETSFGVIEPLDAHDYSRLSPFGAQTHFGQYKGDPEKNLRLMSMAGINWTRDEMYWSELEKTKGVFTFPPQFDAYVAENVRQGLDPLIILDYHNRLYDLNESGSPRAPHTEAGLRGWARYVAEMVTRYRDQVRYWEVWNEPNGQQFWGDEPSAREYAAVLKTAYTTIKRLDPDAVVIGGAIAGTDLNYLRELFDAGGLNYMDVLSIHPYRVGGPDETDLLRDLRFHQELMHEYGYEKPIWLTEIGWATDTGPYGVSEAQQAQYLVRTYLLALSTGYVREVNWYDFQDDGPDPANHEHRFGIVRLDLSPKPAYTAYANLVRQIGAGHYVGDLSLPEGVRGEVFARRGEAILVLWATSARQVSLRTSASRLEVYDIDGNERDVPVDGGSASLTVGPDPMYVHGLGSSVLLQAAANTFEEALAAARRDLRGREFAPEVESHLERASSRVEHYLTHRSPGDLVAALGELDRARGIWIDSAHTAGGDAWRSALVNVYSLARASGAVADMAYALGARGQALIGQGSGKITALPSGADASRPHAEALWQDACRYLEESREMRQQDPVAAWRAAVLGRSLARASQQVYRYEEPVYPWVYLSTPDYNLSAVVGELPPLPVTVHNALDRSVAFDLTVDAPLGWDVAGAGVVSLAPGERRTVELRVVPPTDVAVGSYRIAIGGRYDGVKAVVPIEVDLELRPALELEVLPLRERPAAGTELRVRVANASAHAQSGTLALQLPAGWSASPSSAAYGPLAPGESQTMSFELTAVRQADFNEYEVGISATYAAGVVSASQALDFLAIPRGRAAVDGDLADWRAALPIHLDRASQVAEKKGWTPQDLSAVGYTMWDDEYLYVAVRVTDNAFRQTYTGGDVWRGDGVQFAIDALNNKSDSYDSDDSEWGLTLTPAGPQVWRWYGSGGLPGNVLVESARLSVVRQGDQTVYEAAIPISEIRPLAPSPGGQIGFDLLVNDDDGSGRSGWIEWTPGIGYGKVPRLFDSFTFLP